VVIVNGTEWADYRNLQRFIIPLELSQSNDKSLMRLVVEKDACFKDVCPESDVYEQLMLEDKRILSSISASIGIEHLIILLDQDSAITNVVGTEETVSKLSSYGLRCGCPMSLCSSGINAISVAKLFAAPAMVIGLEHTMSVFAELTSACFPIVRRRVAIGYVAVLVFSSSEPLFLLPMLRLLAENLSMELTQAGIYRLLRDCGLTKQEVIISILWAKNQTALQIAANLKLTESTVRTYIKYIYRKLDVVSKGEFISKLGMNFFEESAQ